MNKYELETSGKQNIKLDPIVSRIRNQYEKKRIPYTNRKERIEEIKTTMEFVLPLAGYVFEYTGAKQVGELDEQYYASGLLHQAWNFLTGTKMYHDFVDYKAEITVDPQEARQIERNLDSIMGYARRKGKYEMATNKAKQDLIYGESFIYRDYEVNDKGENVKLQWESIAWEDVRIPYDDTDWIIIRNWSKDSYVKRYGKDALKKVTLGKILEPQEKETTNLSQNIETKDDDIIQEVIYIDPAQKVFAKIHGGNCYVHTKLEEEVYPFYDDDGTTFSPISRRVFYKPPYGHHGWGVLDILLPTAKLDTVIMNASANRAVFEADPLLMIFTNDPQEAQRKYKKWKRNRARGNTEPFFVSDSNTGNRMSAQNLQVGANNSNFEIWKNNLIQDATMRTGIDFRVLTEYAPTAEQQKLRKLEEDKLNLGVMLRNADIDRQTAQEDLYILRNTTSEFHNITVYIEPTAEYIAGLDQKELEEMMEGNEMVKIPLTIGEFFDSLKNIELDVSPRVEGALDTASFVELQQMKENILMIPQGTPAYNKALTEYLKMTAPKLKVREQDLSVPAPTPNEQLTA